MNGARSKAWLQRALLLIIIGLVVSLFCLVHVTPATFLIFAGAGAGPVFVGLALLGYAAALARRQTGAPP